MRGALAIGCATCGIAAAIACAPSYDSADDEAADADASSGIDGSAASDATATIDAALDADAASAHTFFDDFDNGALGASWTGLSISDPATLTLDNVGLNGSKALVANLPASGPVLDGAFLSKTFGQSTSAAACRVMVYVEDAANAVMPSLLQVNVLPAGKGSAIIAARSSQAELVVYDGAMNPTFVTSSGFPTGRWVELELQFDLVKKTVALVVDQTPNISATLPSVLWPNAGFQVKLGLFESGADGDAVRMRFDDFSCDVAVD